MGNKIAFQGKCKCGQKVQEVYVSEGYVKELKK